MDLNVSLDLITSLTKERDEAREKLERLRVAIHNSLKPDLGGGYVRAPINWNAWEGRLAAVADEVFGKDGW